VTPGVVCVGGAEWDGTALFVWWLCFACELFVVRPE